MAGQSFGDRIVAAQHTLVGSDMSKSICKASTSELMGPKKKHLAYLQSLTNEQNISIPELANCLVERSKQLKWVIVFKSLITNHHLMCYGNERFIQHLASRNSLYGLSSFSDKSGVQGYEMSLFIRKYSEYLNQKAVSYRTVAYDFTRIRRGKDGILRSLDTDKLIKALPVLQNLIDSLLEFDASPNSLTNGVINAAFLLLFKDLIRLFACYNDGIINLLEKYFTMKKSQCREALDLYKRFLTRMNRVSGMLKVAEQVGIDKGDIPDLTQAPSSLLDALEQHLAHLEGKKVESTSTTANVSTFNAISTSLNKMDVTAQKFALEEEKSKLETYKKQREEELQKPSITSETKLAAPPQQTAAPPATTSSASSDLLELFSGTAGAGSAPTNSVTFNNATAFPPSNFSVSPQPTAATWNSTTQTSSANMFGFDQSSATNQQNLFSNSPFSNNPLDSPGLAPSGLLQPTVIGQNQLNQPQYMQQVQADGNKTLESSLADAMANLTTVGQKANQSFEPKTEKKLTGGANYNPSITPSAVTFNSVPMNNMATGLPAQNMGMYGNNMMWNNMTAPMQQPMYGMQHQQPPMRMLNPNNPFGSM